MRAGEMDFMMPDLVILIIVPENSRGRRTIGTIIFCSPSRTDLTKDLQSRHRSDPSSLSHQGVPLFLQRWGSRYIHFRALLSNIDSLDGINTFCYNSATEK